MKIIPYNLTRSFVVVAVAVITQLLTAVSPPLWADELPIGAFSKQPVEEGIPPNWKPFVFPNIERHTRYTLVDDSGITVVRADSDDAASGLIYRQRIDSDRYPILQWRWKVAHILKKGDLRRKQGDDYAARIYVAFAFEPDKATWWQRFRHKTGSLFAGETLPGTALNYIWANRAAIGTIAPNAYAGEAMMVVIQSGPDRCGQWITEQRNLVEDYMKAFNRRPPEIIGIALMTDTDNTGEETTAFYGDIVLKHGPLDIQDHKKAHQGDGKIAQ